jgi:uncharacterized membrane protein
VNWRTLFRWILAVFFVVAGANHFRVPEAYLAMMPSWLPWPLRLVQISGAIAIIGGVGVLVPATRRAAGWLLIAFLVAVIPATMHMTWHGEAAGSVLQRILPWLRLPLQMLIIAWVWWTAIASPRDDTLD